MHTDLRIRNPCRLPMTEATETTIVVEAEDMTDITAHLTIMGLRNITTCEMMITAVEEIHAVILEVVVEGITKCTRQGQRQS